MNPFLFAILLYVLAYTLDLGTALLTRHFKPNLFAANEDNKRFIAYLNKYGTKGAVFYERDNHMYFFIFFFCAILIYNFWIIGNPNLIDVFTMTLLLKGIFHSLGMLTNIIGLVAFKEKKNEGFK